MSQLLGKVPETGECALIDSRAVKPQCHDEICRRMLILTERQIVLNCVNWVMFIVNFGAFNCQHPLFYIGNCLAKLNLNET